MKYSEAKKDPRYIIGINFNGNLKLKNNDTTRFMIWNLPAVSTCPFATEHCKSACYACKSERMYPNVREARTRNYYTSRSTDFVRSMIFTIRTELETKKFAGKKVIFRIHESGDFYNVEYLRKWVNIASAFEKDDRIVFLAYTKSIFYLPMVGYNTERFPNNFIIRSSVWDDTCEKALIANDAWNLPIYTALTAKEMDEAEKRGDVFDTCRCEDCATCGKCWDKSIKTIITYIH